MADTNEPVALFEENLEEEEVIIIEDDAKDKEATEADSVEGALTQISESEPAAKQQDNEEEEEDDDVESDDIVEESPQELTNNETPPLVLTNNGTSNETANMAEAGAVAAVTADRKERLLLEARRDRVEWIQKVPLPYTVGDSVDDNNHGVMAWSSHPSLALLKSSRVGTEAPTVLQVLTSLYDNNVEEMKKQIPSVLDSLNSSKQEVARALPSGPEILEKEILKQKRLQSPLGQVTVEFQSFLLKIEKPECAMLVQGMRNFCRHVVSQQRPSGDDKTTKLATSLNSYINATHATIQSHPAWTNNKDENDSVDSRRSLESFLYGHVISVITSLLLSEEETKLANDELSERLHSLKFITPKHLEVDCFLYEDDDDESSSVKALLDDPVQTLLSVDRFHSPYEKLQRILGVYHGVNSALTKALNQHKDEASNNNKVLPSADHVLPTLILVVLLAQPTNMVLNLKIIEVFCPSEYLRGEAGYAFTNLYGAIQFLRDLNIQDTDQGADTLHMSAQEFRDGLERSRSEAQEKLKRRGSDEQKKGGESDKEHRAAPPGNLCAAQVRAARLRGDEIDINWATEEWQRGITATDAGLTKNEVNMSGMSESGSAVPFVQEAAALSRSYSFLTTRPEEVKISDLPKLLREYRSLVHTTEVLLAERTSRLNSDRKRQLIKERKNLEEHAAAVDFDLA